MLITKIRFLRIKCHQSLSLFKVRPIQPPSYLKEKCCDYDHQDIRSALDFRAATGGILCSGANGR